MVHRAFIVRYTTALEHNPHSSLEVDRARLWRTTGVRHAQSILGEVQGSTTGAALLANAYAHSTQASYQRHWDNFVGFCKSVSVSYLPAKDPTVCRYLGILFDSN